VNCPACQQRNPEGAKFCAECGARLAVRCADCGSELTPNAKFCNECGRAVATPPSAAASPAPERRTYTPKHLAEKILQSRAALEGERKQVTVLFCDIKGSMAVARRLDPEDWHGLLDRFFGILTEGVHRYEGTINQYTGDGVMALFGAPIAHEDHAQRACYAALDLRDRLSEFGERLRVERGIDFGVRMGINSGEVVVGKIGDDLRMDYTAQGHTVGLAQRIEQRAATDRVWLSEHTHRLVEGYFQLRDLGRAAIVGEDAPVGLFDLERATASRTRLDVSRERGLARFVGREAEMKILDTALAHARDGHGQVVGVVGEAGLGKSRLCYEFAERCRAAGLPVYEGHCPAHGRNIPYLPILELFRNYFGIKAQDNAADARRKIAGTLALLDPALQDTLAVLCEFMGVADPARPAPRMDADSRQRQLVALLHRIYRLQAEQGLPSVVVIDDAHWIDPGSDAFLAQLVAATEASRSLLLLNFRPEYTAAWMRSAHYQQLPLVPLGAAALRELVAALLGTDPSLADLAARIVEWTGGNPFYTEEVITSLIELGDLAGSRGSYRLVRDVAQLAAPVNVRALIASRIDRLPSRAKQLLQTAAVIGKEFAEPLLAAIDGFGADERAPAMDALKTANFLVERSLYPVAEYGFKHPLTHEVAYGTQLRQRRAGVHRALAEALAAEAPDKLDERAALMAHHWEQAGEPVTAATWHQRAARWVGGSNPAVACTHWWRVRELLADQAVDDETAALGAAACTSLLHLGMRMGLDEDRAHQLYDDGLRLAARTGDTVSRVLLEVGYGMYRGVILGEAPFYRDTSVAAAQRADMIGDQDLSFVVRIFEQFGALFAGQLARVIEIGDAMIAVAHARPGVGADLVPQDAVSSFFVGNAFAQYSRGDLAAVERAIDAFSPVSGAADDAQTLAWYEGAVAQATLRSRIAAERGALSEATRLAEQAGALAQPSGSTFMMAIASHALACACLDNGEYARAIEWCERGLGDNAPGHAAAAWGGDLLGLKARGLFALGRTEEAHSTARCAVDWARRGELYWSLHAWVSLAEIEIALGHADSAAATLAEAQTLIERTGARYFQPFVHVLCAVYAETFGGPWSATGERQQAIDAFRAMGMHWRAERVGSGIAPVHGL
jgi:class 3 adenylate cyclase/tetratricopeptide (TPR) repeat protein